MKSVFYHKGVRRLEGILAQFTKANGVEVIGEKIKHFENLKSVENTLPPLALLCVLLSHRILHHPRCKAFLV